MASGRKIGACKAMTRGLNARASCDAVSKTIVENSCTNTRMVRGTLFAAGVAGVARKATGGERNIFYRN